MSSKFDQLHIYFFPHMAPGHMIPLVDMARQFARHSVKATIVMTAHNATNFSKTIQRDAKLGLLISIRQVEFPTRGTGLPEGCENLASTTTSEMSTNFYKALEMLQKPLEHIINEDRPDCLVADFFYPWATEVASKFGIPRLVFHGIGVFPLCVYYSLNRNDPYTHIESNSETFIVPDLPDTVKITRLQLPDHSREKSLSDFANIIKRARNSEHTSFGVIVNSFHELEPAYPETYQQFIGRRAWLVGPVSLCNKNKEDKAQRGNNVSIDENECLNWLNSKLPNSVLYICFGSMSLFPAPQLHEIATGLETSGQQFIWVVNKEKDEEQEEWLLEGYEKRMEKKGLIIRGWAPQVLILDHVAVGGFVTHCGWNSLLEGVAAGVPMVTWPLFAEQFYNEKLITDVLNIGVAVGSKQWSNPHEEYKVSVKSNDIANAVTQLMLGQEAYDMRCRARALLDAANKSVEKGGSSYMDLNNLLDELRMKRP